MKDLQEDNLFGSIRERLGRYEEAPSEELWNKIAAARKKDRLWPMFLEPVGIVLAGLVLILGGNEMKDEMTKDETVHKKIEVYEERPRAVVQLQIGRSQIANQSIIDQTIPNQLIPDPPSAEVETIKDSTTITTAPAIAAPAEPQKEVVPPYKKPKSRFQLYFSLTPSLSFQKMSPVANDNLMVEGFAPRPSMSMKRFGFGIDAGFQRDINKILGFYGGLSFYRQHQTLTYDYYDKEANVTRIDDTWTFEIDRAQYQKTFDYSMTNVGIRSGLLVTVKGEKLKHKFGAGLLYSQGFIRSAGSYNNSRSRYIAYQLSYRSELKINDWFSWFIEPMFTYSFVSKEKLEEPFKLKPYRAGISTGLLYRF